MSKIYKIISLIIVVVIVILAMNYIMLQRHMSNVLSEDPRNKGVKVWVHYKWFINPTEIKYDLREIDGENSALDVNRVMLQFAHKIQNKKYNKVYLSYKGNDKFYFNGDYFQNIGKEYTYQNPIYTLRTMPENVYKLNGNLAYGSWEGGWLGVTNKQLEDLNTFANEWYLKDAIQNMN